MNLERLYVLMAVVGVLVGLAVFWYPTLPVPR